MLRHESTDSESGQLLGREPQLRNEKKSLYQSLAVTLVGGLGLVAAASTYLGHEKKRAKAQFWSPDVGNKATANSLTMFKRTHLSIDAIREGEWLMTKVGLGQKLDEYWFNGTGSSSLVRPGETKTPYSQEGMRGRDHNDLKICASRSEFFW
jgi:hypothetical protein